MKKKITRILGVVLTLVLLSSFFIVSAPVSADVQAWSTFGIPGTSNLVLDPGNQFTGPFAITSDGSTIYAATDLGGVGSPRLVKSADGGRTWANTGLVPAYGSGSGGWGALTITDVVVSSIDDSIVYATDGFDIYKYNGTIWVPLTNLFNYATAQGWTAINGVITSIAVGYLGVSNNPWLFAGVSSYGGGQGGVFVLDELSVPQAWADLAVDTNRPAPWTAPGNRAADVYDLAIDPANFGATQGVMAVATDWSTATTYVTTRSGAQWNTLYADAMFDVGNTFPPTATPLTSPLTAEIWLPSNFSLANMQYFVGISEAPWGPGGEGDVYWVLGAKAIDLNVRGAGTATDVYSLGGVGSAGAVRLLASGEVPGLAIPTPTVYSSINNGASWTPNIKGPTGGTSPLIGAALSSVLVLDSTTALVGTHGADNGVSLTNDWAVWNTISLVNTNIAVINDLQLGSVFIATDNTGATVSSIWRNDGNWERVFSSTLTGLSAVNKVMRSLAGDAVFAALSTAGGIFRSFDDGQIWSPLGQTVPSGAVPSWAASDANNVIVGGNGVVYENGSGGGVIWFTRTANIGNVQSFDVASNGDIFAGGATGVARSVNNAVSWSTISQPAGNSITLVTAGDEYASTSEIFVTGTAAGDAGVWSWIWGSSSAWTRIDSTVGDTADVNAGSGIVTAPGGPDGMVYAADGSAPTEGVSRIKGNRNIPEQLVGPTNVTFMGLWYEPAGSCNRLYTIGTDTITPAPPAIYTYDDCLAVAGSGVTVSAITPTTATVTWNPVTNATGYFLAINTSAQPNFYTAATIVYVPAITGVGNVAGTSANITGLLTVTTYNVSVWVRLPVSSYLFDGAATTFATMPTPPAAPVGLVPAPGATGVAILPSFQWAPVAGATSYELQLGTDSTFGVVTSVTVTNPFYGWSTPLEYETTYYWQVRAETATGFSTWVASVFDTMAEPAPPITVEPPPPPVTPIYTLPPITLPPITVVPPPITVIPPDIIIPTQPPAVIQLEETAPAYIWAIIGIGAVLVIAVIVLIVRTRRVV